MSPYSKLPNGENGEGNVVPNARVRRDSINDAKPLLMYLVIPAAVIALGACIVYGKRLCGFLRRMMSRRRDASDGKDAASSVEDPVVQRWNMCTADVRETNEVQRQSIISEEHSDQQSMVSREERDSLRAVSSIPGSSAASYMAVYDQPTRERDSDPPPLPPIPSSYYDSTRAAQQATSVDKGRLAAAPEEQPTAQPEQRLIMPHPAVVESIIAQEPPAEQPRARRQEVDGGIRLAGDGSLDNVYEVQSLYSVGTLPPPYAEYN